MVAPFEGGCACKAVRYEVSSEPIATMECHCRDCQRASGGASTVAVVVPRSALEVTKGTPKSYAVTGDSGGQIKRFFCAECGSPLFSEPSAGAFQVVKAGSLDDPSWLTLAGAIYTSSAQPWAHIDPNKLKFETMPPGAG
jgi:hypothetical protein